MAICCSCLIYQALISRTMNRATTVLFRKFYSLYDNIWFASDYLAEYTGVSGIDKFDETDFGNDDKAANLAVSDHRPAWADFYVDRADDDGAELP